MIWDLRIERGSRYKWAIGRGGGGAVSREIGEEIGAGVNRRSMRVERTGGRGRKEGDRREGGGRVGVEEEGSGKRGRNWAGEAAGVGKSGVVGLGGSGEGAEGTKKGQGLGRGADGG
jgi:hypothetical protein